MKSKKLNLEAFDMNLQTLSKEESRFILGGDGYDLPEVVVVGTDLSGTTDDDADDDAYDDAATDAEMDQNETADDAIDPHALANLPENVEQQISGACVSYALAFVTSYFGGNADTGAEMALLISQQLGLSPMTVINDGLTTAQESQVISQNFEYTAVTSTAEITAAIDEGHPVVITYVTLDENGNEAAHEVVVVGYDNDSQCFIIANSQAADYENTGGYELLSYDDVNYNAGAYEIEGLKNN